MRTHLILAIVVLLSGALTAHAQEESLLQVNVSESRYPELAATLNRIPVQRLLLDLAAQPRAASYVDAALNGTGISRSQLERLGLIRLREGQYVVGLYLLTRADLLHVREVTDRYAQSLADALLTRRTEIEEALKPYDAPGVDPKAVAYFALGCVSLDWDGLDLTIEKGYRKDDSRPSITWIGSWWVAEANDLTWEKYYWGSHNSGYRDVSLTSFGDHNRGYRVAFPDLIWFLKGAQDDWPESLRPILRSLLNFSSNPASTAEQAGQMLLALRDGEKSVRELAAVAHIKKEQARQLLEILVELEYVALRGDRYQARVPVLTQRDQLLMRTVRSIGREVMEQWFAANYDKLKEELSGVTPWRYGQSFEEGFYPPWHCIFGAANRKLVEAGLFADPYAESRKFKGYIPVVFHSSVTKKM